MIDLSEMIQENDAARTVYQALSQAGGQIYIVGGAIRDTILGKLPKDIDLMVTGLDKNQIIKALKDAPGQTIYTGDSFPVFRFKTTNNEVEIAMPRTEISTGKGHKDFDVQADPNLSVEEDLKRRDFTGNAMAWNVANKQLIDPHNGQEDLMNKKLSLVNEQAFEEDPLRIVRALVSYSVHDLEPDLELIQSMKDNADQIRHLPGERIQAELDKLLNGSNPTQSIELAFQTGVLDYILPELSGAFGFDQHNPHHDLDVGQHSLAVLTAMTQLSNDVDLRLVALLHDIGKPDSFWLDDSQENGGGHFYKKKLDDGTFIGQDHHELGADMATELLRRLRYPSDRATRITSLVRNHMWKYFDSTKGARRFLNSVNGDIKMAMDLITIREADASGKKNGFPNEFDSEQIDQARRLIEQVVDSEEAFTLKDLAINGNDLKDLGFTPGPEIGNILRYLLNAVLDDPSLNTKDQLFGLVESRPITRRRQRVSKISGDIDSEGYELISTQPRWKWSYDGSRLLVWPVDPEWGRPHHIEVTGGYFYKLAQGRIYVDDGLGKDYGSQFPDYVEILVWEDRGTKEIQQQAIQLVEQWIQKEMGRPADLVSYQNEGIQWMNLERSPTTQEMKQHYYGIPQQKDPDSWYTVSDDEPYEKEKLKKYKQRLLDDDFNSEPLDWGEEYENRKKKVKEYEKKIHNMTDAEWDLWNQH